MEASLQFAAVETVKTRIPLLTNTSKYEVFSFPRMNYSVTSFLRYSGACVIVYVRGTRDIN